MRLLARLSRDTPRHLAHTQWVLRAKPISHVPTVLSEWPRRSSSWLPSCSTAAHRGSPSETYCARSAGWATRCRRDSDVYALKAGIILLSQSKKPIAPHPTPQRAFARVDKKRVQLSDNQLVEDHLGDKVRAGVVPARCIGE